MNYTKFNIETWLRKEHYNTYEKTINCGFSLTSKIDITNLKKHIDSNGYKFYPTIIYLLSRVANTYKEFRFANKNGELILWDKVNPSFTIFHKETETFSSLWCEYSSEMTIFMDSYHQQVTLYKDNFKLYPQPQQIDNVFYVSSLPWVSFDSFNLNIADSRNIYTPIFTMGKYYSEGNKIWLPLSVQVHHAVCDGFHVGKFLTTLQKLCDELPH
ncbi:MULTISPECIES: type A chloramphenicol O-acetyltransferase [Providencia]|uniref:type A chloramphenicol O-acetyltransferase n=1 Tax=Providencia TaxID=586 RepID=UPI000F7AE66E|nr:MULTISPECIES: type A chloramphenicol O-acetyltransferase [Providencia]ELR5072490.1 type A chloramphenicol O-acetyltransferase [Providencia stuartii]ELR5223948.1 type A chloramphenicol O-acetyltransferase [Providencia rettgeri]ELR5224599.1 type A chloramphenicol O-acetyltransferase [Providencia rettgeri]MBV2191136.1 type A chloramphenicol O-acetyltransferase [Providencia rettgeri]MDX7324173.1 type A chloramphenicol O-acetyltransferase [Providencia rettgeri]